MAIILAGKTFTVQQLQDTAGRLAAAIRDSVQAAGDFNVQLQTWPDADLVEMGLTQEQVNAIKGFFIGDLPTFQNALKNSVWIKQLLGLGV